MQETVKPQAIQAALVGKRIGSRQFLHPGQLLRHMLAMARQGIDGGQARIGFSRISVAIPVIDGR